MKITKVILLCFVGLAYVRADCGKGTLHCNAENKPTICDFTQGYVMNAAGDACEQKTVEGCEMINFNFSASDPCFLCAAGKVMDATNETCVDVPADNKKDFCKRYNKTTKACVSCDADYYEQGGACVAVGETKIDKCAVYTNATTCASCDAGYYVKANKCEELPKVDNCLKPSNIQCDMCTNDYFLNPGLNSSVSALPTNLLGDIASGAYSTIMVGDANTSTVCQKKDVRFCWIFSAYNECSMCATDYMISDTKKCQYYPETPIEFCEEYTDKDTCKKCTNATHYLSGATCTQRDTYDNCAVYEDNENKCKECDATHFLETPAMTVCTERNTASFTNNTYKNCQTSNPNKDECFTCNDGTTMTGDKLACLTSLQNCQTPDLAGLYSDVSHKCTTCINGYTLNATSKLCEGTPVADCKSVDGHATNASTCTTCNTGFYPNADNTACVAQNIAGCANNGYLANKNQCNTCQKLKKPSAISENNTCVDIANLNNCLDSNGVTDDCDLCEAGFYLVSNACKARDNTPNNCYSNDATGTDSDKGTITNCTACNQGYSLVTGAKPLAIETDLTANCMKLSDSDDECSQCKDNFFLTAGSPKTCTDATATASTNNCMRQKNGSGATTDLTQVIDCEICNPARGYYSKNSNCVDNHVSNQYNCSEKTTAYDATSVCRACATDEEQIEGGEILCAADSTGRRTFVTDCAFMKPDGTCLVCDVSKVPDANGQNCIATTKNRTADNSMGWLGEPIGTIQADDPTSFGSNISNCKTWAQITPTQIACVECNTDFVGIVAMVTGLFGTTANAGMKVARSPMFTAGMQYGPDHTTYNPFIDCVPKADGIGKDTEKFNSATGDCAAGVYYDNSDDTDASLNKKFSCIRCADGLQGNIMALTESSQTSTIGIGSTPFSHIQACASTVEGGSYDVHTGTGVGYGNRFNFSKISENMYTSMNTCPSGKTLVYFMVRTNYNPLPFNFVKVGAETTHYQCIDDGDQQYASNEVTLSDNCAIAILASDTITQRINNLNKQNLECIACKKGSIPEHDSNTGAITNCAAPISSNCNDMNTANPNWLGSCIAADKPFVMEAAKDATKGSLVVDFTTFDSGSSDANCKVSDAAKTKCVICAPEYTPNSAGVCTQLTTATTNCTTVGIGRTALTPLSDSDAASTATDSEHVQQFLSVYSIRAAFGDWANKKIHKNSFCGGCAGSRKPVDFSANSSDWLCGKHPIKTKFTPAGGSNCLQRSNTGGCAKCTDNTFIPSTSDAKCVLASSKPNCVTVSGNTDDCDTCDPGFKKNGAVCEDQNCKVASTAFPDFCIVCADNSPPGTANNCLAPVTDSSLWDDCINYAPGKAGQCMRCRNTAQIPYVFNNNNVFSYRCVNWARSDLELGYKNDYTYLYVIMATGGGSITSMTILDQRANMPNTDLEYSTYTKGAMTAEKNCLPNLTSFPDCKTVVGNMYCNECNDGFSLNVNTNACEATTVTDCKVSVRDDKTKCTTCNDTHFRANETTCTLRQKTGCNTTSATEDKCTSCVAGKWLDVTPGTCTDYTAVGCLSNAEGVQQRAPNSDNCTACATNFYVTGLGDTLVCNPVTSVTNCVEYSGVEDKCTKCNATNWLDTANTPNPDCKALTTVEFCSAYEEQSDSCKTCEGARYFRSASNECRDYPNGVANCVKYEYPDKCVQCAPTYWLESASKCTEVTAENRVANCLIHTSATACGTCEGTHFKNGNECETISAITGCIEYSAKDKCKTCTGTYYLDAETCANSNITGCIDAQKGDPNPTCNKCDGTRYLSEDKRTCTNATAVPNCDTYKDKDTCEKCNDNFLLSADKTACDAISTKAGANCSYGSTLTEHKCDVCQYGFKKDAEGACVAISTALCIIEDAAGKCLLCAPNSSMDKDGKCTSNVTPPNCTGDDCDISVFRLSVTISFVLAFFLLKF